MASLPDRILAVLANRAGLTDRELAETLGGRGAIQQPINQAARSLERQGRLQRRKRTDGLIGNYASPATYDGSPTESLVLPSSAHQHNHDVEALSEDEIKTVLVDWLKKDGWSTKVAWGRTPGIDIEATKAGRRRVIEVKGPGSRPQMRVNYFLCILGEMLQRMSDANAEYLVALPDLAQFRGLWSRLPELAKRRTGISAVFVSSDRKIEVVQ